MTWTDTLLETLALHEDQRNHLHQLVGSWSVLADLSFSDLLLLVDAGEVGLVVLGQVRPATSATMLRDDLVGRVLPADEWPLAVAAMQQGLTVTGRGAIPAPVLGPAERAATGNSEPTEPGGAIVLARLECVPVRIGDVTPAVIVRLGNLEERRRPGRLERAYERLYQRLTSMVEAGTFASTSTDVTSEDAPRVGDGLIVVDADERIRFASPNAMSALHRVGVAAAVEGSTLAELGVDDVAVHRAITTGVPVIEEAERRPDVIVLVYCTPLIEAGRVTGAMVLLRDVTDLRRLGRLLLSKDAAIREVHHRVKNNLQTISSLLRLQARRTEPGVARQSLEEAERRIRSIAVVHEIFSRDPGDQVPFDQIVSALVRMAEESNGPGRRMVVQVFGDLGAVSADVATPMAIVLAELLQNASEHAFGRLPATGADHGEPVGGPAGAARAEVHVDIVLANEGDHFSVLLRDDGVGLPAQFSLERSSSLGLSIVRDLVTSQLGGRISMDSQHGTLVSIEVPFDLSVRQN